MNKIIIGTRNEAKVKQLRGAIAPLGIIVEGMPRDVELPYVEESGMTVLENARKKATTYAKALGVTVLSMDNALYFDELSDEEQPGLSVRRIHANSERPTDDEMLRYYSALVGRFGERTTGRWEFGICVASPDGMYKETIITSPRIFASVPSMETVPGYPLESIQIDPETKKYISEMNTGRTRPFLATRDRHTTSGIRKKYMYKKRSPLSFFSGTTDIHPVVLVDFYMLLLIG